MLLSCLRARREPSIRCIEGYQKNKALLQKSPRKIWLFCKRDLRNMCVCVYVCMCVWKALLRALKQELQSQCCCIAHCELSQYCVAGLFCKRALFFEGSLAKETRYLRARDERWMSQCCCIAHCDLSHSCHVGLLWKLDLFMQGSFAKET